MLRSIKAAQTSEHFTAFTETRTDQNTNEAVDSLKDIQIKTQIFKLC